MYKKKELIMLNVDLEFEGTNLWCDFEELL